jgi:hypothetical protein
MPFMYEGKVRLTCGGFYKTDILHSFMFYLEQRVLHSRKMNVENVSGNSFM